ncbi:MAG: cell division protein SepF [Clostridia bacterium]|nr:cell division protein SepF [Clostridia bacterium]
MSDLFNRFFNRLSGYQDEMDYDEDYEQEMASDPESENILDDPRPGPFRRQQSGKVVDMHTGNQQQVVIMQPADIDSAQQACDYIRAGKTVICNIEKVDPKVAQRVIDFITGAAYALDGKVMPVSSVIFVVAPRQTTLIEESIVGQSKDYMRDVAMH